MKSIFRAILVLAVLASLAACAGLVVVRLIPTGAPPSNGQAQTGGSGLDLQDQLVKLMVGLRAGEINSSAGSDTRTVTFTVRPGDTTTVIAGRLQAAGLIRDAELFRLYVRSRGSDGRLEAGEYALSDSMTLASIALTLEHAKDKAATVTFREGLRAEEDAEALRSSLGIATTEFLAAVKGARLSYGILTDKPVGAGLEGYLFPDTYEIAARTTPTQVVDLMVSTIDQRFTPAMRQQAALRQQSVFQILTLASLVEREAQAASERPIIASVYINRLAQDMPLEADSTVQYALGYDAKSGSWWRTLILEDLRREAGPYSTYLTRGLPPGPICNPGLSSIEAALQPAKTDYLYYYAKGDGTHAFAKTFEEHQQNMRTYGR